MPLPVLCTAGRDSSGADLYVVLDGKLKAMTQAAAVSMLLTSMRKLHTQKESASQQLQQRLEEVRHSFMVRAAAAQMSACLQDNVECIGTGRFTCTGCSGSARMETMCHVYCQRLQQLVWVGCQLLHSSCELLPLRCLPASFPPAVAAVCERQDEAQQGSGGPGGLWCPMGPLNQPIWGAHIGHGVGTAAGSPGRPC